MTHTPGPWRVVFYDCGDTPHYDYNGPCPSVQATDEQDCAIVHWDGFKQKYWSSANGNQRQIEANARLIAAAPCLLEELEQQADGCSTIISLLDGQKSPVAASLVAMLKFQEANARAAIAKAKGDRT